MSILGIETRFLDCQLVSHCALSACVSKEVLGKYMVVIATEEVARVLHNEELHT